MQAMVLDELGPLTARSQPLRATARHDPSPGPGDILVRVSVCGVCHTELDEIEGRTPPRRLPVVPGHQAIGRVAACGAGAHRFAVGDRVGVAWIHATCGQCPACRSGRENLCPRFRATGRDVDGGYAELLVVSEDFAHAIPDTFGDAEAAPLLCAGAIGYRALQLCTLRDGDDLGLFGFGASAHLVLQMVRHELPHARVHVFARSREQRDFAQELGAHWCGDIDSPAPVPLRAAIDTTPAWRPVLGALAGLQPGGRLVINAIRKESADQEALLGLDYERHLWQEKEIQSVANVTRSDVRSCLDLAARTGIRPEVEEFALQDANRVLAALKHGKLRGAKVLRIG